jgi:hypothetical protein
VDPGWINCLLLDEKNPFLANMRSEPRFEKLMERVKYEWEHFDRKLRAGSSPASGIAFPHVVIDTLTILSTPCPQGEKSAC